MGAAGAMANGIFQVCEYFHKGFGLFPQMNADSRESG
jgi:hypothetical protein